MTSTAEDVLSQLHTVRKEALRLQKIVKKLQEDISFLEKEKANEERQDLHQKYLQVK